MESKCPVGVVLPSRRVLLGGAVGGAGLVAGCDLLSTDPGGSDGGGGSGGSGRGKGAQAPELDELVAAGELPAVEERLPAEPLVVEPTEDVGVYGGEWRTALVGAQDLPWIRNTIGYDGLVRWSPDWQDVVPNIAESFEVGAEGREFTFVLRPGMKWSDGEPFTAHDIVFACEDILGNPEISPEGPPALLRDPQGTPAQVEAIDDHTVQFAFDSPKGLFLEELADPQGAQLTMCPGHYLEQFHDEYSPDAEDLADEAGVAGWVELIEWRRDPWDNTEVPVLFGWRVTTPISDASQVVAERNPYYWKVDPDGSQLPYLDQVIYEIINDTETMLLRAADGDLNMHARHINNSSNRPVLADGRESGGYDFFQLALADMNDMVIMFNLNHKDETWRNLFQDKNFRIGLSHAINRQEIIDTVMQQQGEARQAAPGKESVYYDEEFALQYTEYDVDLANEYLDEAGLTERDDNGFRLFPDGAGRVVLPVQLAVPAPIESWQPSMELIETYWEEVGIEVRVNSQDRSIWTDLVSANDHDVCVWGGAGGLGNEIVAGYLYLPFDDFGSRYALEWAAWYSSEGEDGEEPPEVVREQLQLYDQALGTIDEQERQDLFNQVIQIAKEQFYAIGIAASPESYGIVANNFHNVPESMPSADTYGTPGPTRPEQYYVTDE